MVSCGVDEHGPVPLVQVGLEVQETDRMARSGSGVSWPVKQGFP
jgi:hypothetical protein